MGHVTATIATLTLGLIWLAPLAAAEPGADGPEPVAKLLKDLAEGFSDTRRGALEQLARSDDPRAVGATLGALADDEPAVRRAAVLGLWRRMARGGQHPGTA